MDAPDTKSLPENAYTPLAPGEVYAPIVPAGARAGGGDRPLGRLGPLPVRHLHRRLGLLGAEGRAGHGGVDPDLDPGDRPRARLPAPLDAARERHHHQHRRHLGRHRGGRDLHPAGALHPQLSPAPAADHLHLPRRRLPGRALPDPAAALLRARDARPASRIPEATAITEVLVTGEKGGSQAKLLLQATGIAAVYDFFVTTFQVWREIVDFQFIPVMKALADRAPRRGPLRRHRLHPRPRLRHGPALVDDPVRRRRSSRTSCWCR